MRTRGITCGWILAGALLAWAQSGELKTVEAVLDRYKQALGGVEAIRKVQSETAHGDIEASGLQGKATFVSYSKPFKSLFKVTRPDGKETVSGFDGKVSWTMGPEGVRIDKETPVESVRRDADLQYPLHQPDYFKKLEFKGVSDFEGHPCYWLHGITRWDKDNNQFYDVQTGLLAGYRFVSDDPSGRPTIAVFSDYKKFGARLMPTRLTAHSGDRSQTIHYTSVTYEPLDDSLFALPDKVKDLLK